MSHVNLIRSAVRIRNPASHPVTTWLEPQAEQFQLLPGDFIDFVFIGPSAGMPEVLPATDGFAVYGWHGSQGMALQNGKLLGGKPKVARILQRALSGAAIQANPLQLDSLGKEIELIQATMDAGGDELSRDSQKDACKMAAYLADELGSHLPRDESNAAAIWDVAQRLVALRGVFLAQVGPAPVSSALWGSVPSSFADFVESAAYTCLPGPIELYGENRASATQTDTTVKQRSADSN